MVEADGAPKGLLAGPMVMVELKHLALLNSSWIDARTKSQTKEREDGAG